MTDGGASLVLVPVLSLPGNNTPRRGSLRCPAPPRPARPLTHHHPLRRPSSADAKGMRGVPGCLPPPPGRTAAGGSQARSMHASPVRH
jgi:hypothetical protein